MVVSRSCCVLALVAAFAASAAEPPAEGMTWQEANKRSAALIRERGHNPEAADFARIAFELYPQQTRSYSARTHAQLLLNLVGVLKLSAGSSPALDALDRGAEQIERRAGATDPVLVEVWREGAKISQEAPHNSHYNKAVSLAEKIWGPNDARTIEVLLDLAHALRRPAGYTWTLSKVRSARERAVAGGASNAQLAEIDLVIAKLHAEVGKKGAAREAYVALVDRLEQQADPAQNAILEAAYAQLEHFYAEAGDVEAATDIRKRRARQPRSDSEQLVPIMRTMPAYPRDALQRSIQGVVDMHLEIRPDGTVAEAKVIRSEPPGVFDKAALTAIRKWKFQPKIVDGKPVASKGKQTLQFFLEEDGHRVK
jgi:TonB family protein